MVLGQLNFHMPKHEVGMLPSHQIQKLTQRLLRAKTTKLLEENTEEHLYGHKIGSRFLHMIPKA